MVPKKSAIYNEFELILLKLSGCYQLGSIDWSLYGYDLGLWTTNEASPKNILDPFWQPAKCWGIFDTIHQ